MTRFGDLYRTTYAALCGTHPQLLPWHFQWLSTKDLYADIRRFGPRLEGRVLDVGCGDKPYGRWLTAARSHFGIDVYPGPRVDAVIQPGVRWPLEDASFDAVLCTQVLEHTVDLPHVLAEIHRVLRPGGLLLASVPFAYNEHASPNDYRRLTYWGVKSLFDGPYEILALERQGGIGSTVGTFCLNWVETAASRNRVASTLKAVLLPVWIVVTGITNLLGVGFDAIDRTGMYYSNVVLHARRRTGSGA